MVPSILELRLMEDVERLRAEVARLKGERVLMDKFALDLDAPVHDTGGYPLVPFIKVTANRDSINHPTEHFYVRWQRPLTNSWEEVFYKAEHVMLSPLALDAVMDDMLRRALTHIIHNPLNKV